MIPRGTTPTIRFTLPEDSAWTWSELSDGRVDITYARAKCAAPYMTDYVRTGDLISKPLSECAIDGRELSLKLSEAETLRWEDDGAVELQVCAVLPSGDILKSFIVRTKAYRILNEAAM